MITIVVTLYVIVGIVVSFCFWVMSADAGQQFGRVAHVMAVFIWPVPVVLFCGHSLLAWLRLRK